MLLYVVYGRERKKLSPWKKSGTQLGIKRKTSWLVVMRSYNRNARNVGDHIAPCSTRIGQTNPQGLGNPRSLHRLKKILRLWRHMRHNRLQWRDHWYECLTSNQEVLGLIPSWIPDFFRDLVSLSLPSMRYCHCMEHMHLLNTVTTINFGCVCITSSTITFAPTEARSRKCVQDQEKACPPVSSSLALVVNDHNL